MNKNRIRIGFIGAGNLGSAMIDGLLKAGHEPACLEVADPDESKLEQVRKIHADINVSRDNAAVASTSDVLILAVKPQVVIRATENLRACERPADQLLVSVAAGITLDALRALFDPEPAAVRIMPNQPAMVGAAMSVMVTAASTGSTHRELAEYVSASIGRAEWIDDEALMDAVTAISGSGPAYFYLLAELIEENAKAMGLSDELAGILTRQTLFGAGKAVAESMSSLAEMRKSVTSKGGTTAAALEVLEDAEIRDIVRRALHAARDRSIELGDENRNAGA